MKEIDIAKARQVIYDLRFVADHASAALVWDLLDFYIATKPEPIKAIHVESPLTWLKRATTPEAPQTWTWKGGAHCTVDSYDANTIGACSRPPTGRLVMVQNGTCGESVGESYLMCSEHGATFDRPGFADWVQTLFGGEDEMPATTVCPSVEDKLTVCTVSAYNASATACAKPSTGYLVRLVKKKGIASAVKGEQFPMCTKHGEMLNRPDHAQWLRYSFNDEDEHAARMRL